MANILMVSWPLYEVFDIGEEVVIGAGEFTGWTNVAASKIKRASMPTFVDIPFDRFQEITSLAKESHALLTPHVAFSFPITGLVLSCRHAKQSTVIQLYVTNQNPTDFRQAMTGQILGAIPAYWVDSELEKMWDKWYVPDHRQQRDMEDQRPRVDSAEALDTRGAALRLYRSQHCFDYPAFAQYTGYAEQKLAYAERHRNRLRHLRTIRHCIYGKHSQPEYFSPLLTETVHETLVTLEALLLSAVSALDLLARAVDHFLCITVSPTQRVSRVTFAGLLRVKDGDDLVGDTTGSQGINGDLPLAVFWNQAWDEWLGNVIRIRHAAAHDTCLQGIEVSHGGVAFEVNPPRPSVDLGLGRDCADFAEEICEKLGSFFKSTFQMITEIAEARMKAPADGQPAYSPNLLAETWSPETRELTEALELWVKAAAGDTKAATAFYHRLHPDLKREWRIQTCREFLKQHALRAFHNRIGGGGTDKRYGYVNRSCVRLDFGDKKLDAWFMVAKPRGRSNRWHIIRDTLSTFPDFETRLTISGLWRKQSGKETGHRDVECGCELANMTDFSIREVALSLLSGYEVQDFIELATATVGTIEPGESINAAVRQKDGCMPPFGARTLSGPATLRVCYTLPDGQRYAADAPFADPRMDTTK